MSSSSEIQCPGRQEPLAAMVEGELTPDERADLIEHMGDCETCYKIYTELLLVGEEDDPSWEPAPIPAPEPPRPAWNQPRYRWAAAAAALATAALAAMISVPFLRQDPPAAGAVSSGALTAALTPRGPGEARLGADWAKPPWPVPRNPEEDLSEAGSSLRLGARAVDLDLALLLGETDAGGRIAGEMAGLLDAAALHDVAGRYARILERLGGEAPSDLVPEVREAESALDQALGEALDAREYRLGKLAEAGRLAGRTGDAGFFDDPERRRLYAALLEELGTDAPQELREAVERIGDQGVEASELGVLGKLFEEVLRRRGSG